MKKAVWVMVCGAAVVMVAVSSASAIPPFFAEFKATYIKDDDSSETTKALKEQVDKVKCNVCHGKNDKGKLDTKVRNAYGEALDKLLDKKEDAKNKAKIREALEKVAEEKSADAEDAPTYGELLAGGKLPVSEEEEAGDETASK